MKYLLIFVSTVIIIFGAEFWENKRPNNFQVGTKDYVWSNDTLVDPYYGGPRILNARVWYPTNANYKGEHTVYYYLLDMVKDQLQYLTEKEYLQLEQVKVNSFNEAPIAKSEEEFPLIIFSPSLQGNISYYTYYAENLARSGYVIVGINHLYESEYVVNKKGKIFSSNVSFHDSLKTFNIPDELTPEEYRTLKGARQEVLAEDLIFALDKICSLNNSEFYGMINCDEVGVWGHSIGGAAAIYASFKDDRFSAVVNIDGTPPSVTIDKGIEGPFLFIEDLTDYKNHPGYAIMHNRRNRFCNNVKEDAYRVLIRKATHNSFLDINYYLTENDQEKKKALIILNIAYSYLQDFFDRYLKEKEDIHFEVTQKDSLEVIRCS